jgi:hypothetical protein
MRSDGEQAARGPHHDYFWLTGGGSSLHMEVVEAPDYSLPEDDELFQKPAKAKRKKRGLRKKDKDALGMTSLRGSARVAGTPGRNPTDSAGAKPRQALLFFPPLL